MKIDLSYQQAFTLAGVFAQEIHNRVIEMHLWTCDHVFHPPEAPCSVKMPSTAFNEVCAAVRSLPAGSWDRRAFVGHIKFHFDQIRAERGTAAKWQDHLARVKEVNKDVVPKPFVLDRLLTAA